MTMSTPTIYIVSFSTFILVDKVHQPVVKIGTTCHPHQRKWDYLTSSPNMPVYRALFTLECTPKMLYTLDGSLFRKYLKRNNLFHLCVENGGGIEWYYETDNFVEIISNYLYELHIPFTVELEDKYLTPPKAYKKALSSERNYKLQFNKHKEYFLRNIVPSFRSIQEEFWDMFTWQKSPFRGIIKLPTGVGKTLIVIISLVIAKFYSGKPLKALIVCPQTNIFDTTYDVYEKFSRAYKIPVHRCYGNHSSLSSFQDDSPNWVILATHQGCIYNDNIKKIPYNFILYDEVHKISGPEFFESLSEVIDQKDFVIGTSATPLTDKKQIRSLVKIFPNKAFIECSYKRAIAEKWIVKPRFDITIKTNASDEELYITLGEKVIESIAEREEKDMNKGRKVICYIPQNIEACKRAMDIFLGMIDNDKICVYYANDDQGESNFLTAANDKWHVMYTCQKYREGSDIKGLEMNFIISGSKIKPYLLLQTAGRTLRNDYEGKEGWCHILKKSDVGQDANSILLSVYDELIKDFDMDEETNPIDRKDPDKKIPDDKNEKPVHTLKDFLGKITIDNEVLNQEEALQTIENLYLRRDPNSYDALREYNMSCKIKSRAEYFEYLKEGKYKIVISKPEIIHDPELYFGNKWKSWGDYLGIDTFMYPKTYDEFVSKIRSLNLSDMDKYYEYIEDNPSCGLPKEPQHLYRSFKFYPRF